MKNTVYQDQFGETGNCFAACLASLFGWELRTIPNFFGVTSEDWWANVRAFLKEKGYGIFTIGYSKEWLERQEGYFIVSGKSHRELTHAVIYHKGKMFHDPHPDGTGIEPSDVDIIYKTFECDEPSSQSLTAPAVDVDGLKKGLRHYLVGGTPAYNQQVRGWNDCIDYLAARGYFGNVKEK